MVLCKALEYGSANGPSGVALVGLWHCLVDRWPLQLVHRLQLFGDDMAARASAHDDVAFGVDDGLDMHADLIALVLDSLFFGAVLLGLFGGHSVLF